MLAVIPILTLENLPPPSVGTLSLTIYTCDLCGKQSETNDRLLKHIETYHGDTFCSDSKLNSEHLPNDGAATINHNDVNHGLQYLYTCYKCDETFATHNLLASHVQTFHCEISWFTCNIFLNILQTSEEHNVHVELFHPYPDRNHVNDESVYGCHLCEKIFTTSSYLQDHMRSVHALVGDTIPQTDGNETLGDTSVMTEREIYEDDPDLLPTGYSIREDLDPVSISKDVTNALPPGTQSPPGLSGTSSLNSAAREYTPNLLPTIDQH